VIPFTELPARLHRKIESLSGGLNGPDRTQIRTRPHRRRPQRSERFNELQRLKPTVRSEGTLELVRAVRRRHHRRRMADQHHLSLHTGPRSVIGQEHDDSGLLANPCHPLREAGLVGDQRRKITARPGHNSSMNRGLHPSPRVGLANPASVDGPGVLICRCPCAAGCPARPGTGAGLFAGLLV